MSADRKCATCENTWPADYGSICPRCGLPFDSSAGSAVRFSEATCEVCGKKELPLGWPTPTLCLKCRQRDRTIPQACPFCGNSGGFWPVQECDGSAAWIECAICHARGPRVQLRDLAMPMWNRRKSPNG